MPEMQIKKEFLNITSTISTNESQATEITTQISPVNTHDDELEGLAHQTTHKKQRSNKHTKKPHYSSDAIKLCHNIESCILGDLCRFSHDIDAYFKVKGEDLGPSCHNYETLGYCRYGMQCRFASQHLDKERKNMKNEEIFHENENNVMNIIDRNFQKSVRSKTVEYPRTVAFYKEWEIKKTIEREADAILAAEALKAKNALSLPCSQIHSTECEIESSKKEPTIMNTESIEPLIETKACSTKKVDNQSDKTFIINQHVRERKKIDFSNKTYLAPLTTVGNLPFRRICKEFGVDITCGEMALSQNLLLGNQAEWALMRRHKSEDLFGVQLCGPSPYLLTKAAELVDRTCTVDFIDINCGCPIDMVFNSGAGSALLSRAPKMVEMLHGMSSVIDATLTLKIRTGIIDGKPIAHKLVKKFQDLNVGLITLHGRTRQQRYTKLADWDYINTVSNESPTIPMFGNGDVMNFEDYYNHLENSSIAGVMIGRGALIKPWIFTEIKEKKVWDISSSERLDMLKRFGNYGLEQWGSDTMGINQTRRFMCEWLSFLCRYVPVGLLEVPRQHMNDRPAAFIGRDDLETLMGSQSSSDWVKLTEMVLGKSPDDFSFVPK